MFQCYLYSIHTEIGLRNIIFFINKMSSSIILNFLRTSEYLNNSILFRKSQLTKLVYNNFLVYQSIAIISSQILTFRKYDRLLEASPMYSLLLPNYNLIMLPIWGLDWDYITTQIKLTIIGPINIEISI